MATNEAFDEGWTDAHEGREPRKGANADYQKGYNAWFHQMRVE